jgi:hypothetical protein
MFGKGKGNEFLLVLTHMKLPAATRLSPVRGEENFRAKKKPRLHRARLEIAQNNRSDYSDFSDFLR